MLPLKHRTPDPGQRGAITIMVALMLLVLLTIAAVGMSRNAFREAVSSGFVRQGAMARNVADSGLEWSMYWIDNANSQVASGSALSMVNEANILLADTSQRGLAKDIITGNAYTYGAAALQTDQTLPLTAAVTAGYTIGLTSMGKVTTTGSSQTAGPGFRPAMQQDNLSPNLWAIRADARVVQGGVPFIHAKEAWVSTPVQ